MKTVKFRSWECDVLLKEYVGQRMALMLVDSNTKEPVATCTINLPDFDISRDYCFIKDYSENEGMLDALIKAEVVSRPIHYVTSGMVTNVPLCKYLGEPLPLHESVKPNEAR